ncbi:solute carrier family 26 protein [Chlamydia pecorum]|uniref:Sulfate transporter family protein n=1 Tax=Chlamydia pecorum (strain ATCC VR-628 / DSM 29919 / E58) TaxID=331635 RepID=A0AA34WHM1_CHLPE|nr:solute carrier family 26 protein [Chlamydia pecorum]AEB41052.1 sulfate transporter family protein [Chlamydia pecorum E58]AGW39118.1 sulfate transporter family protein [Chlamydia pecorum W73]AGW40044.1 sulfate transporter family protein [Chlamydia pecorum P787]ETF38407.1 sulfate transporter family protein [Chlamydia pecorum VR629]ETF38913.1 sulfate transporter family protein [Chlamydia pecorum DBDeUG]
MTTKTSWSFKHLIPTLYTSIKEGYSFNAFKKDFLAGITVGILAFPFAIAVSIGIGVSPIQGLIASIIGGFLASALGGSQVLISGPTSAFISILYCIVAKYEIEGLFAVTLLAGIFLVAFGLTGLGTFIKYMPYPVVTGLTTGIAVLIFSSQIKDFLGLQMGENVPTDFIAKWVAYWDHLWTWDSKSFAVGLFSLLLMIYFRNYKPRYPGVMIAIIIATTLVWLLKIDIPTIESRYGTLPQSLPLPVLPRLSITKILQLMPEALTIAVLTGIETLLAAVVADGMIGSRHQSNCQLVGQGIANIGTALFSGIPVSGSLSRTAANIKSGALTPISGLVHSVFICFILLLLAPLTIKIPLTCLAAVLILIAWNMSEIHHFIHLFTAPKKDVVVLLTVFVLTVMTTITSAVQVGMMLAAFLFMKQMSDLSDAISSSKYFDEDNQQQKKDEVFSKAEVPLNTEIYEINGPFFFGIADRLKNILNEIESPPKIFILCMSRVPTIDASAMHALEEFFLECNRQGTLLLLAGVKKTPLGDLKRYHLDQLIGVDHIFSNIKSALLFAQALIKLEKKSSC